MLFSFNNITYTFGPGHSNQIKVSGSLAGGEVLVVRGPSGAGKSTLLRVLSRLQPCLSGEGFLNGESWLQMPGSIWRASVHYIAQKPAVFDGTVADNLVKPFEIRAVNGKKAFDPGLAKALMEKLLLASGLWNQDARTLSGGEVARLAFVRALLIEPQVLLLDEPVAALDDKSRKAFYSALSDWLTGLNRGAVLVSHNNDDLEFLHRVSYLDLANRQEGA